MDFFTIAEATSPSAINRFLRSVARSVIQESPDDDFSQLDTSHTSHHDYINSNYQSDSIMDNTMTTGNFVDDYLALNGNGSGNGSNRPMLSPIAEAELFMLATNFLLCKFKTLNKRYLLIESTLKVNLVLSFIYLILLTSIDVAIVLIITMIAKIYFPEALERTEAPQSPRSYNYRISNEQNKEDPEHENFITSETDSSFDEDFQFIADSQALIDGDLAPTGSTQRLVGRRSKNKSNLSISAATAEGASSSSKSNDDDPNIIPSAYSMVEKSFAFEQESTSKHDVLKRLFYCVISLNVTFVIWGVLQERMLTRRYPRYTGEFFTYSYALVFTNRFWTLIMSTMLWIYFKPKRSCSTVIYEYSFPSISNMLSSWCQYESLRYVSFPAVTLFKSFKLAPVMAMGKFLGNKQCKLIVNVCF
jgi:hypothetical protein